MSLMSDFVEDELTECIEEMEMLRHDLSNCDSPYDMVYGEANRMLNDCISIVKKHRGY